MIKDLEVQVDRDFLSYQAYPLRFPHLEDLRNIKAADIELVFLGLDCYQLLLRNGNVVLFPREKWIALREFVRGNGIATVYGTDPWNLLTEPYLDQSYTPEETRRTIELLGQLGFPAEEVESIRKKIGSSLFLYNMFVWEWISLGLLEVLHTHKPSSESFYRWATSISIRGYRQAKPRDLMEHRFSTGMDTVLWSQFENFSFREGLWPKGPYRPSNSARSGGRSWWRRLASFAKANDKPKLVTLRPAYKEWNPVYRWLFQQYSEPHRHYHNLDHVAQVSSLLESLKPHVSAAALLAGWFHDCIYQPGDTDNEEKSAQEMAARFGPLKPEPQVLRKAEDLVLYTRSHSDTADPEERMLHDADLGIFGMHRDAYAKYAADIRKEYASVPDDLFKKGRTELLEKFLAHAQQKGRFFYVLDPIFERQVESNLLWEIGMLKS